MSKRYSKKCSRRGLTLIEVVTSVALLLALLVMMLTLHARHLRQINTAFEKQQAAELMDQLLGEWFSIDQPFPANQSGTFANRPGYSWRTSTIAAKATNLQWNAQVTVVEIVSQQTSGVVTRVELLESLPSPENSIGLN